MASRRQRRFCRSCRAIHLRHLDIHHTQVWFELQRQLDGFLTVFFLGLGLVQTLQGAVVALVEAPVAHHWDPVAVGGVECDVRGADSTAKKRGIEDIGQNAFLREQLTAALGLPDGKAERAAANGIESVVPPSR